MTKKKTICILPWVHFDEDYRVNNTRLLRYPEYDFEDSFKENLKEILKSYRELKGNEIKKCTIVAVENASPEWNLNIDKGDLKKIQSDLSLFFLSSISKNKYFVEHSNYTNSTAFQPVFQSFIIPIQDQVIQYRRRDSMLLDGGYKHKDLKYSRPLECKSLRPKMDKDFLIALSELAKGNNKLYRRILGSIFFVQLANTDQPQMSLESEAILMASAFEQLFDAQNKYKLTCAYKVCFSDYEMKKVKDVLHVRRGIEENKNEHKGLDSEWQLGRKWIQELYNLRNEAVHGGDLSKRKWGWSPFEHLVMAAFVFPLAVKILLSKENKYKLTEVDKQLCTSIDLLLATKNWNVCSNPQDNNTNWEKVISEASGVMLSSDLDSLFQELISKNEPSS